MAAPKVISSPMNKVANSEVIALLMLPKSKIPYAT